MILGHGFRTVIMRQQAGMKYFISLTITIDMVREKKNRHCFKLFIRVSIWKWSRFVFRFDEIFSIVFFSISFKYVKINAQRISTENYANVPTKQLKVLTSYLIEEQIVGPLCFCYFSSALSLLFERQTIVIIKHKQWKRMKNVAGCVLFQLKCRSFRPYTSSTYIVLMHRSIELFITFDCYFLCVYFFFTKFSSQMRCAPLRRNGPEWHGKSFVSTLTLKTIHSSSICIRLFVCVRILCACTDKHSKCHVASVWPKNSD